MATIKEATWLVLEIFPPKSRASKDYQFETHLYPRIICIFQRNHSSSCELETPEGSFLGDVHTIAKGMLILSSHNLHKY